jgi:thiamine pyrophosphokinase
VAAVDRDGIDGRRDGRPVVVLAGGDPVAPAVADGLPAGAWVVAADSGLDHAVALGLAVDLVVGDLDSVSPQRLAAARAAGVEVQEHPSAKDATDLALALDAAAARGPAEVVLVGGHGGRLDHLLANALVVADDAYAHLRLTARMGPATVTVVRDQATLSGTRGELVSLLPVHGPATGVTTQGLLYPLTGEDLPPGSTRGVSNELTGTEATVELEAGVLLAVQPGVLGTHQLGPRT